jgi:UDP-N-acetylmuramoyl-tripeptide--D-alanyl-D-alanine ligase
MPCCLLTIGLWLLRRSRTAQRRHPMTLTFDEAAQAVDAQARVGRRNPTHVSVSTDTRTLRSGQTFLALRGERFDGHEYVEAAVRKGAAAVIVDRPPKIALEIPVLVVEDTRTAYMRLAAAARLKLGARVIAITGSVGKTTTKALLHQLLAPRFGEHVAVSPANENNEVGVSKLFLNAPPDAQAVVVEMGARHFGDIQALVNVALPEVGILTNVREAHLEIMQSPERLAQTKWALFSRGARAVLNVRDDVSRERAPALPLPPHWFGTGDASLPNVHAGERGVFVRDRRTLEIVDGDRKQEHPIDVRLPGEYNLENLAAAVAGSLELGSSLQQVLGAVPALRLPPGRYESIEIGALPRLIYDAYNASPSGTIATLDAFAREPGRRHIAILASMAELGASAAELHRAVGAHAARIGLNLLLVGGENARDLRLGAQEAGLGPEHIVDFHTNEQAAGWIRANARADDVVLLKGSRRYKLDEIVEKLRA